VLGDADGRGSLRVFPRHVCLSASRALRAHSLLDKQGRGRPSFSPNPASLAA